ncbi:replication endonuclease [Vibrio parahaemolyticus]|nr:replication endonuclease [Vibrio parahaemolyticus]
MLNQQQDYIHFLDDTERQHEGEKNSCSDVVAFRKRQIRTSISIMHHHFIKLMNENDEVRREHSLKAIEHCFNETFYMLSNKELKTRFNPAHYFNQSEENTRDTGEELCVYIIYLLSLCAKESRVGSLEFRVQFYELIENRFTKNLQDFFIIKNSQTQKGKILRWIDKATCRNKFNKIVKEALLFEDMCQKNIGSKKSKIAMGRQVDKAITFSEYAGERSITKRIQQLEYRDNYLKSKYIRNGKTAFDFQKKDSSKAAEAYLEMLGMEEKAEELGYKFLFITPTCPPEYHSNSTKGKKSKWKYKSAKEGNDYLNGQWRKLGKSFDKKLGKGLRFGVKNGGAFGKKVVEPHKDGCPHWHLILFCKPSQIEGYKKLFMHFFSRKSSNGKRFGCEIIEQGKDINGNKINKKLASPASYILKYMQKTQNVRMEDGNINDDNNIAVDAWKHATRIRTQANFGINGVKTKFNDCRKIANKNKDLFFDIINKEAYTLDGKSIISAKAIKKARKAFFIRVLRQLNINPLDLKKAAVVRGKMGELIEIIKASSAKTKLTKASKLSKNNDKKKNKYGTDYKKFMDLAGLIEYTKKAVENRFEEIVKVNARIGTANISISLT